MKHYVSSDNFIQSSGYLHEIVAGKSRVGNKMKRGREEWNKGVRDGAKERAKNGIGWK